MFFRENLKDAVRERVYPKTALHRKVLAAAIGRHPDTIDRIVGGGGASLDVVGELSHFFHKHGDHGFLADVFGIEPASQPVAAAVAALEQAKQRLLEVA